MDRLFLLCLSSIQHDPPLSSQNTEGTSNRNSHSPQLADTGLVYNALKHDHGYAATVTYNGNPAVPARKPGTGISSPGQQTAAHCMPLVRSALSRRGLSSTTIDIISSSWRASTQKQYATYQKRWVDFAQPKNCTFSPSVRNVLEFLTQLFQEGIGYSGLNTARSALSAFLSLGDANTIGSHPLVTRFMKGVFHLRTPQSRYSEIWDVSVVLNHLRTLHPLEALPLKCLTHKLLMLIALVSAQRIQTILSLNIALMRKTLNSYIFTIEDLVKQSKPGRKQPRVILEHFPQDERLSVFLVLSKYLEVTGPLRGKETQLFISYMKPHHRVSNNTLARWLRETMAISGVDVFYYKAHSTRAASVSAAKVNSLPLENILRTAGWSSESTFAKFYNKPITQPEKTYAASILSSTSRL